MLRYIGLFLMLVFLSGCGSAEVKRQEVVRVFTTNNRLFNFYTKSGQELKFQWATSGGHARIICDVPSDKPMWYEIETHPFYGVTRLEIHIHGPEDINNNNYMGR